jgi:transposase-like protein
VETAKEASAARVRKRHDPQFIESILKLVQVDHMPVAQVAGQAGISPKQIYRWLQKQALVQARQDPASDAAQQQRMRELERENQYLKKQVEFLKKAASYFAAQNTSDLPSSPSMPESTR